MYCWLQIEALRMELPPTLRGKDIHLVKAKRSSLVAKFEPPDDWTDDGNRFDVALDESRNLGFLLYEPTERKNVRFLVVDKSELDFLYQVVIQLEKAGERSYRGMVKSFAFSMERGFLWIYFSERNGFDYSGYVVCYKFAPKERPSLKTFWKAKTQNVKRSGILAWNAADDQIILRSPEYEQEDRFGIDGKLVRGLQQPETVAVNFFNSLTTAGGQMLCAQIRAEPGTYVVTSETTSGDPVLPRGVSVIIPSIVGLVSKPKIRVLADDRFGTWFSAVATKDSSYNSRELWTNDALFYRQNDKLYKLESDPGEWSPEFRTVTAVLPMVRGRVGIKTGQGLFVYNSASLVLNSTMEERLSIPTFYWDPEENFPSLYKENLDVLNRVYEFHGIPPAEDEDYEEEEKAYEKPLPTKRPTLATKPIPPPPALSTSVFPSRKRPGSVSASVPPAKKMTLALYNTSPMPAAKTAPKPNRPLFVSDVKPVVLEIPDSPPPVAISLVNSAGSTSPGSSYQPSPSSSMSETPTPYVPKGSFGVFNTDGQPMISFGTFAPTLTSSPPPSGQKAISTTPSASKTFEDLTFKDLIDWTNRIFVASYDQARNWESTRKIDLAVNCTKRGYDLPKEMAVKRARVAIEDLPDVNIVGYLKNVTKAIETALDSDPSAFVLIYCLQGLSRSPAIFAGVLIEKFHIPAALALDYAKRQKKGGHIKIRPEFLWQLDGLAEKYGAGMEDPKGRATRSRQWKSTSTKKKDSSQGAFGPVSGSNSNTEPIPGLAGIPGPTYTGQRPEIEYQVFIDTKMQLLNGPVASENSLFNPVFSRNGQAIYAQVRNNASSKLKIEVVTLGKPVGFKMLSLQIPRPGRIIQLLPAYEANTIAVVVDYFEPKALQVYEISILNGGVSLVYNFDFPDRENVTEYFRDVMIDPVNGQYIFNVLATRKWNNSLDSPTSTQNVLRGYDRNQRINFEIGFEFFDSVAPFGSSISPTQQFLLTGPSHGYTLRKTSNIYWEHFLPGQLHTPRYLVDDVKTGIVSYSEVVSPQRFILLSSGEIVGRYEDHFMRYNRDGLIYHRMVSVRGRIKSSVSDGFTFDENTNRACIVGTKENGTKYLAILDLSALFMMEGLYIPPVSSQIEDEPVEPEFYFRKFT